jgi:N-acetyl-gamma-glutamyl-phosphate reductase
MRVAIVGSTGYGGVELIRLLQHHPQVKITSVISSSTSGVPLTDGFPHLSGIVTDLLDGIEIDVIKRKADLVFTATPSGVSTELVPKLLQAGLKVIDLSGDFRLKSPSEYELWYKHKPAEQQWLDKAVYGLTEVYDELLAGVEFISNPGCYPTATTLGLIPLVKKGLVDLSSMIVDAKSGVSGAGRGLNLTVHYAEINENFKAYKINKHQHIPEIEQVLSDVAGQPVQISFTTHLVPMTRGIMCTMYANLTDPTISEQQVVDLYREFYQNRRFVRIRDVGKWPATKEVAGSNYCDIGFSIDSRTGRITIVSVIDNVVKGAAGQAIQNLNIMMGLDETTGLMLAPVYP